ncbi:MAG: hypothetical protein GC191_12125 [Azospirillum sp.]|nr:hypothetical protein [Azospirillum sp.]
MIIAPVAVARPADWPERLAAFVASHRETRFAWGRHDCLCFVADWLAALGAADPMAPWRGRYHDGGDADLFLSAQTATGDVFEALDHWLPRRPVREARRGDVAGLTIGAPSDTRLVGLVIGPRVVAIGFDGLVAVPLSRAIAAWGVG